MICERRGEKKFSLSDKYRWYFQDSHEKSVVNSGKLSAPEDPAVLDKSPRTAPVYMVDIFLEPPL